MGLTPSSLPETLGSLRRVDHFLETTQATRSWGPGGQPVMLELMPRPQPTEGQSGLAARTRPASACQSKTPASCMGFSKTQSLITTRYLKHPGYNPQLPNIYRTRKIHLMGEETG